MSYATLMVHLDLDRSNDTRLRIAGELAARFDGAEAHARRLQRRHDPFEMRTAAYQDRDT